VAKARAELDVQKARLEQVRFQLIADKVKPAEARKAELIAAAQGSASRIVEEGRASAASLRDIARTAKGALKLPGVSQAISAAAVAFPPLGVPAMVAFKVANTAIAAAERGGPQAAQFARQVGMLKHVARRRDAAGLKARKALKVLHITHQWRRGLHAAQRQATQQAVRGLELPEAPIPDPMFMLSGNPPLFLSQGDPLFGRPY